MLASASQKSATSNGRAKAPVLCGSIKSGMPPSAKATHGVPQAMASTRVLGRLSCMDGAANTSAAA